MLQQTLCSHHLWDNEVLWTVAVRVVFHASASVMSINASVSPRYELLFMKKLFVNVPANQFCGDVKSSTGAGVVQAAPPQLVLVVDVTTSITQDDRDLQSRIRITFRRKPVAKRSSTAQQCQRVYQFHSQVRLATRSKTPAYMIMLRFRLSMYCSDTPRSIATLTPSTDPRRIACNNVLSSAACMRRLS